MLLDPQRTGLSILMAALVTADSYFSTGLPAGIYLSPSEREAAALTLLTSHTSQSNIHDLAMILYPAVAGCDREAAATTSCLAFHPLNHLVRPALQDIVISNPNTNLRAKGHYPPRFSTRQTRCVGQPSGLSLRWRCYATLFHNHQRPNIMLRGRVIIQLGL